MKAIAVHSKALLLLAMFWNEFLPWYILIHPLQIIKSYFAYTKVCFEYFSFIFLLRTLFAPWKSIADPYPENWLNIVGVMQALSMNLTARGVGFVVRILTIALGLVSLLALLIFFVAYFITWFIYPFFFVLAIPYLLSTYLP